MIEKWKAVMAMVLMFLGSACGGESVQLDALVSDKQQSESGMPPEEQGAITQSMVDFYYLEDCNPLLFIGNEYTYDDTQLSMVKYTGTWKAETPGRGLYMGTQHITNVGGSTVSFTLPRASYQFAFGFTKMRNAGKASVHFNGEYVTTIDMYAPVTTEKCVLQLYWSVPPGTLTVKALNQRNPSSTGTYINTDFIYYEP